MSLPDDEEIVILAVEVEDVLTFGDSCTPVVAGAIPRVIEAVLAQLECSSASQSPHNRKNEGS
jgi:Ni,Fe-hydrogenase maturation factor